MYALRNVEIIRDLENDTFEKITSNYELGCAYSKIDVDSKRFKDLYPDVRTDGIICMVSGENGVSFFIEKSTVDHSRDYYIMTESGKTFERLN